MIRFKCIKCGEKCIGGPEDNECPLCGGTLVYIGEVYHD
jgi:hypothetical protein